MDRAGGTGGFEGQFVAGLDADQADLGAAENKNILPTRHRRGVAALADVDIDIGMHHHGRRGEGGGLCAGGTDGDFLRQTAGEIKDEIG